MNLVYNCLFCIVVLCCVSCTSSEQQHAGIKGTFKNFKIQTLYLEKLVNPKPIVVDSAVIDDKGVFEFKTYKPTLGFYRVKIDEQRFITLVVNEHDNIEIEADFNAPERTSKIKGSVETDVFLKFNAMAAQLSLRLDSLNTAFQSRIQQPGMDSIKMMAVSKEFELPYYAIVNPVQNQMAQAIVTYSNHYACLAFIQPLDPETHLNAYIALDKGLFSKFPNDRNVLAFHESCKQLKKLAIGQESPNFVLSDPAGVSHKLTEYRGKWVLIDFWASWCGPCKAELPRLVKLYAQYKSSTFEIIGVSLDKDKSAWMNAIDEYHMTWPQLSDLQFWESTVVPLYGIQSIPFTVLIDPQGIIRYKNLRGTALQDTLKKILKN